MWLVIHDDAICRHVTSDSWMTSHIYATYTHSCSVLHDDKPHMCKSLQHALQHTATNCNKLMSDVSYMMISCHMCVSHGNTHCNAHCNTLQHTYKWYVIYEYFMSHRCKSLQHTATHCNTLINDMWHMNVSCHMCVSVMYTHTHTHSCPRTCRIFGFCVLHCVLQHVAVCVAVCVAVYVAVCCSVSQRVAVCCIVLQCVLQGVAVTNLSTKWLNLEM